MHWAGVVKGTAKLWTKLRALVRQRRVQLALSFRATIAALASFALAQFLQLPLPLWAVLTALIVTQLSVGRSLKVTFDYLLGTLGGAIYAGAIGVLIPHSSEIALLAGSRHRRGAACLHRHDQPQIFRRADHGRDRVVGPLDDPHKPGRFGN
jgi:hypothetical protein